MVKERYDAVCQTLPTKPLIRCQPVHIQGIICHASQWAPQHHFQVEFARQACASLSQIQHGLSQSTMRYWPHRNYALSF